MNDDLDALARLVLLVADDLDRKGYPATGPIRRYVRETRTTLAGAAPTPGCCPVCGELVVQPERGRRRVYCSATCRRARNAA